MLNVTEVKYPTVEIDFNGETITVTGGLSTLRKNGIIAACLRNAGGDGFYSRMLYEASLYGMIVLSYTDIKDKITDFDKVSLVDLYDYMDQSGLVQKVIHTIHEMNPKEIDTFIAYASKMFDDAREDGNSASSAVQVVGKAILSSLDTLTKSMKEYSDKLLDTEEKDDEPANLDFKDVTPNKMN